MTSRTIPALSIFINSPKYRIYNQLENLFQNYTEQSAVRNVSLLKQHSGLLHLIYWPNRVFQKYAHTPPVMFASHTAPGGFGQHRKIRKLIRSSYYLCRDRHVSLTGQTSYDHTIASFASQGLPLARRAKLSALKTWNLSWRASRLRLS
jgi:hypothetical protein